MYTTTGPSHSSDLWLLAPKGDRKAFPLAETEFSEANARFSPDSRWVTYTSNETGRFEVYVQSVPVNASAPRAKWRVSSNGGSEPKGNRNGRELFYVAPDKTLLAVAVKGTTVFEAGIPKPLFKSCGYSFAYPFSDTYDDAPDGRRTSWFFCRLSSMSRAAYLPLSLPSLRRTVWAFIRCRTTTPRG